MSIANDYIIPFVIEKTGEWNSYHAWVSEWERDRYLRFF